MNFSSRLAAQLAVVSLAAMTAPVAANDTAAELAIGGLKFARTAHVAMESEQLNISLDEVRIRYQFRSTAPNPITLTVAFPLPDIDLSAGEALSFPSADPLNFVAFATRINGQSVKYTVDQRAFLGDKDVSAALTAQKIALLPIGDQSFRADQVAEGVRKRLADEGLLQPAGTNERGKQLYEPAWLVKTSVIREQTFPSGQPVIVEHSYRPAVGANTDTILRKPLRQAPAMGKELDRYRRDYCVTDAFLGEIDKLAGSGKENTAMIQERRISYVLKTGANWAGPIKDFKLTIDGGKGRLVSFCSAGLSRSSTRANEYHANDFVPTQDLKILIVGKF